MLCAVLNSGKQVCTAAETKLKSLPSLPSLSAEFCLRGVPHAVRPQRPPA